MTTTFTGRREDLRLVTGQGRYAADCDLPGQAQGHFLRADRAHAAIRGIDTAAARAVPGVLGIFTGADTLQAGFGNAPPMVRYPGKNGMQLRTPFRHMLATDRVRFVGEAVALVVAESAAAAQDAAELIAVDYEDLPAVVEAADALLPDAPLLHRDVPGNIAFDYEYGDAAKTADAFAGAAHVVRLTLDAQRIVGNPMEPKSCLAAYDAARDVFDLYAPTQGMSMMQGALSGITGLPPERLRVHAADVGGGFGIRGDAYPEYLAVMLAAKSLGRPVKWVGTRSETIMSDHHGRAALLTGALALDRNGTFLAARYEWLVNLGAYCTNAGPFINTAAPAGQAVNVYRIPAVYGFNRLVLTNTTPTTAYRGAGRPNVSYLTERLVDEAARVAGIDRVEIRRRNLLPKDAFPYKTPTGSTYDSGDPPGLLEAVVREADWAGFAARRQASERGGRLRGRGIAIFIEPSGGGSPKEEVAIKFGSSGNADLYALAGPSGQGHETVFPEVVAEIFGLPAETITLRYSDPDGPRLVGAGTIGSRSLMNHGGALVLAAREVVRKGLDLAARDLEVAASDLVFEDGRYRVPGTDLSVGLDELARRHAGGAVHPLDSQGEIAMVMAYPSGAHVAEVEIDPETGIVELASYVAVDDCGRVLNHTLVAGQMHGGIMQGIGQVLGEHCLYDRATGQLLTGSFMDYYMPHADILPPLALHDHPVLSPSNPLGAKGAGEAGTTGCIPTLGNAVIDALRPLGIDHLDMPYSPHRVWAAIRAARG